MNTLQIRGNIPEIIRNDEGLYEGDLKDYFRIVFKKANNLNLPYHNFRHVFHVVWLCYRACQFYRNELTPRAMRNLLVAALFHDFNHTGRLGNDDLNVEIALRGLRQHILVEVDEFHLPEMELIIRATEFPYKTPSSSLGVLEKIIRDADVSQALSVAWIQQVILGLAAEWGMRPIDVLKKQGPFMNDLKFYTDWAKQEFPKSDIEGKIKEARELLELLGEDTTIPSKT